VKRPHPANQHSFPRGYAAKIAGGHDSTLQALKIEIRQRLQADARMSLPRRKVKQSMPLIQLLEVLIVVGVLLWLVNRFIPMQGSIKSILNGVVVIAVVLWLLNVFGLFHSLSHLRVGS
jgi:hypothetical protein